MSVATIEDSKMICGPAPELLGYIGAANDASGPTIGYAPKILTSNSKQFRLLGVEIIWILKNRFTPCC